MWSLWMATGMLLYILSRGCSCLSSKCGIREAEGSISASKVVWFYRAGPLMPYKSPSVVAQRQPKAQASWIHLPCPLLSWEIRPIHWCFLQRRVCITQNSKIVKTVSWEIITACKLCHLKEMVKTHLVCVCVCVCAHAISCVNAYACVCVCVCVCVCFRHETHLCPVVTINPRVSSRRTLQTLSRLSLSRWWRWGKKGTANKHRLRSSPPKNTVYLLL